MKLSIVTVNKDNAQGLEKTLASIATQTATDFEIIVVDGASTDGSLETIGKYRQHPALRWVSEPDSGIYNGMNKGIRMAKGEYVMMLNSGDWLTGASVLQQLLVQLEQHGNPPILYGTTINIWPDGRTQRNRVSHARFTMFSFYRGTLDHVGTCIRRELFDRFGMYDETLRICSDWAWFMKVVALGQIQPLHVDVDTVYFDMTGISEGDGRNRALIAREKRDVLQATLPPLVLADYDAFADDVIFMRRLHRHPLAFRIVQLIERVLFKIEKRKL
ncbi:MAG: glycosyltransferase [Bacteroidales bacterium]|nr:glycosyltransferase [Bacteroidales bacterium]